VTSTIDDSSRRRAIERQFECAAQHDPAGSHALYHEDAVLEFPQSGERFEGVATFREWRSQYPAAVEFRLRRISGSGDVWVRELSVSYDGGPWMLGVAVLEFRGDRIARERIYVTEPWPAPAWRAPWRSATEAV
jgi:hypothetical protein